MTCVLGHARVLDEAVADPRRRVIERRDGHIAGAAAYEPLYGPAAEIAVALEDPADTAMAARLVDAVVGRMRDAGLQTLRLWVDDTQEPLAVAVLGVRPVEGEVAVRLGAAGHSVPTTEPEAQRVPMSDLPASPTMET